MQAKHTLRAIGMLLLAVTTAGCNSRTTNTLRPGQRSADYITTSGNETDRLHMVVTRGSSVLSGYVEIELKDTGGKTTTRRIPITGEVSTDGVPATITIPSAQIGIADLTLGCFFDKSLNLQLVGDNRRRYPHLMYRVAK
jgi:hypothetical protein